VATATSDQSSTLRRGSVSLAITSKRGSTVGVFRRDAVADALALRRLSPADLFFASGRRQRDRPHAKHHQQRTANDLDMRAATLSV
jgi:hypothetical protein